MIGEGVQISFLQGIAEDVERSKELMLSQLVQQLQGSIALPACLHLVGLMRRMGVFIDLELCYTLVFFILLFN